MSEIDYQKVKRFHAKIVMKKAYKNCTGFLRKY
jgi:hypothetical protein